MRLELAQLVQARDPHYARFIELQVRRIGRQRQEQDPDTEMLPGDERALLAAYGEGWAGFPGRYTCASPVPRRPRLRFHRGLISFATMDADVFVEVGHRVMRLAPIRHVDFVLRRPGALKRLLECVDLCRLESVGFPAAGVDDEAVKALGFLGSSKALIVEPMTPDGTAIEAAHGYQPWLHWANRMSRFDARWYADQGLRPVPATPAAARTTSPTPAPSPAPVRSNLEGCAGCGQPVIELTGQFTRFESYLTEGLPDGSPNDPAPAPPPGRGI